MPEPQERGFLVLLPPQTLPRLPVVPLTSLGYQQWTSVITSHKVISCSINDPLTLGYTFHLLWSVFWQQTTFQHEYYALLPTIMPCSHRYPHNRHHCRTVGYQNPSLLCTFGRSRLETWTQVDLISSSFRLARQTCCTQWPITHGGRCRSNTSTHVSCSFQLQPDPLRTDWREALASKITRNRCCDKRAIWLFFKPAHFPQSMVWVSHWLTNPFCSPLAASNAFAACIDGSSHNGGYKQVTQNLSSRIADSQETADPFLFWKRPGCPVHT